jgi:hypothetical protein
MCPTSGCMGAKLEMDVCSPVADSMPRPFLGAISGRKTCVATVTHEISETNDLP